MTKIKWMVFFCGLLLFSTPLAIASYGTNMETEEALAQDACIEAFSALYCELEGDTMEALRLLTEDPGLELVDCRTRAFQLEDGALAECGAEDGAARDLQLTDIILCDRASGGCVYFGTWDWADSVAAKDAAESWDSFGFCIEDPDAVRAREYMVSGYSKNGVCTVRYDTAAQTSEGSIQKGADLLGGVTFWYDDTDVDHGLLCVPLHRFADAPVTQLWMTMEHTAATAKLDFQIIRKGLFEYRFFIRWDADAVESNARSAGVDI